VHTILCWCGLSCVLEVARASTRMSGRASATKCRQPLAYCSEVATTEFSMEELSCRTVSSEPGCEIRLSNHGIICRRLQVLDFPEEASKSNFSLLERPCMGHIASPPWWGGCRGGEGWLTERSSRLTPPASAATWVMLSLGRREHKPFRDYPRRGVTTCAIVPYSILQRRWETQS
jgi:hypothetical protein